MVDIHAFSRLLSTGMNTSPSIFPPDYHSHTWLCKHAYGEPSDYAAAATAAGLPEIACTDHCPTPIGFAPEVRMEPHEFDLYRDWVMKARAEHGIDILFGVEADYHDGCEEYLEPFLKEQPLDIVLGSVHYLAYDPDGQPPVKGLWETDDAEGNWKKYLDRVARMTDTGLYDVAGHLDLPKRFGGRPDPGLIDELMPPVMQRIANAGMAVEINTSGFRHLPGEQYPSLQILNMASELEIPVTFGSDAHTPTNVGQYFEEAVILARRAGYTHYLQFKERQGTPAPLP